MADQLDHRRPQPVRQVPWPQDRRPLPGTTERDSRRGHFHGRGRGHRRALPQGRGTKRCPQRGAACPAQGRGPGRGTWPEAGPRLLDAKETGERVNISNALGSIHQPHAARIHPAKLVRGLAEACERLGVRIYEGTAGHRDPPPQGTHRLWHRRGRPTSCAPPRVSRQTSRASHREWLPMNSSMIATAPLPDSVWDEIGWNDRDTVGDMAHAYMYAQRTEDGRIALGGRGVPYRYGSQTDTDGATQPGTIKLLTGILHDMFPATRGAAIDHAWAGVLGVPRDWKATVGLDKETGHRLGRRLRRHRSHRHQPCRPHAARFDPGPRQRTDPHAVGEPQGTQVGGRTGSLDRRPVALQGLRHRGPGGEKRAPGNLEDRPSSRISSPAAPERFPNEPHPDNHQQRNQEPYMPA